MVSAGSSETVREVNTFREASNPRSTTGAKSVLNPSARISSPMTWPCMRYSRGLPLAKTDWAEGTGEIRFLSRSTVPPSRSTHKNMGSGDVSIEAHDQQLAHLAAQIESRGFWHVWFIIRSRSKNLETPRDGAATKTKSKTTNPETQR